MKSAFARHPGLPFVPHPAPEELLGSWLLRVAQLYGLGLTTLFNRLDARPGGNARVEHWFTLGGGSINVDALSSALRMSRSAIAAMAPTTCRPRWPAELGACARCLAQEEQNGKPITWNRNWVSPLAIVCGIHGTWLTPVATQALAGVRHVADFDIIGQRLALVHTLDDETTFARDALWLQDLCTARKAHPPHWGSTRRHDMIRIVDAVAREVIAASDSGAVFVGPRASAQEVPNNDFTFELGNDMRVGMSLPTKLRQRQWLMATVAHVLRRPTEERACLSSWPAASIKRLASMHKWPNGALAWVCPAAA